MRQADRNPSESIPRQLMTGWLSASHGLSWLFFDGNGVWWGVSGVSRQADTQFQSSSGPSFAALSFLELFEGPSARVASAGAELRCLSVQEFFAWAKPMAELAQDKVAWRPVEEAAWQAQWTWMQERWANPNEASGQNLRKAVPVLFETGWAASSNFEAWWLRRLLWAVQSATETRAVGGQAWAYAYWDQQEAVVGVTPEILFVAESSAHATTLKTHAVAGTRWIHVDQRDQELADFLAAGKDAEEQALVVDDLRERLQALINQLGGTMRVGERQARAASPPRGDRQLWHLVTPLDWRREVEAAAGPVSLPVEACVRSLHPTAALGVAPRSSRWLKEFDEARRRRDGIERGTFGAPLLFSTPDTDGQAERLTALVGIRQVRVRRPQHGERFAVEVAAGAGVLPSSERESEWHELAAKREAIKRMLGLSAAQGNVEAGVELLLKLIDAGARSFVYCAGARNAPLVAALEILRSQEARATHSLELEVLPHFEEREAAFFALGRARRDARPAVVICTSGTAVAELLPAITEALYVGAPLVALTADRPKRLRGTGAPQAIDQRDLFGRQAKRFIDFEVGDSLEAYGEHLSAQALRDGPTHINFCCDEPLLSGVEGAERRVAQYRVSAADLLTSESPPAWKDWRVESSVPSLILVSGLQDAAEIDAVRDFLLRAGRPVWLEATSGLRGDPRLQHLELLGGEAASSRAIRDGRVRQVWRLGSVPTTRLWRDLDDVRTATETISISRLPWSGLGRGCHLHHPQWWLGLRQLAAEPPSGEAADIEARLLAESASDALRLKELLRAEKRSEPSWFHFISEQIPSSARVYVGNSLPIREWDLAASRRPTALHHVEANRGVNGIDGQVSTALGLSRKQDELWIVVGDLTALYNLAGPWLREQVRRLRIVVINNGGGRIFSRVFRSAPGGSAAFENRHAQSLAAWAELWDLESFVVRDPSAWPQLETLEQVLIEIHPDAESTARFWSAWEPTT